MPTDKVVVHLYEPRNRIEASVTIPTHLVYDFDAVLAHARQQYPAYTASDLIRQIWVRGLDSVRASIFHGSLPNPGQLPRPASALTMP